MEISLYRHHRCAAASPLAVRRADVTVDQSLLGVPKSVLAVREDEKGLIAFDCEALLQHETSPASLVPIAVFGEIVMMRIGGVLVPAWDHRGRYVFAAGSGSPVGVRGND